MAASLSLPGCISGTRGSTSRRPDNRFAPRNISCPSFERTKSISSLAALGLRALAATATGDRVTNTGSAALTHSMGAPDFFIDSTRCARSEEHTSELQSLTNLVCRLLLEKKKHNRHQNP